MNELKEGFYNLKKVKDISYWTDWEKVKDTLNKMQFTKKEMALAFFTIFLFTYDIFDINIYYFFTNLTGDKEVIYLVNKTIKAIIMFFSLYILAKKFKFLFPYKDMKTKTEKMDFFIRSVGSSYTLSGMLCAMAVFLQVPLFSEVKIKDVQGVSRDLDINIVSDLSLSFLFDLPLEEFLCLLMFFFFYKILLPKTNKAILISVLLSSLIFGLWHINYNTHTILPIAFSRIAMFIMLFVYRDILGLIVTHYLNDVLFLLNHLGVDFLSLPIEVFNKGFIFILIYVGVSAFTAKFIWKNYHQITFSDIYDFLMKKRIK